MKISNRLNSWLIGLAVVAAGTLAAAPRASADTITTFDVSGSFDSGAYSIATGSTVTIDTTTGMATASSITVTGLPDTFSSLPNTLNSNSQYTWTGNDGDTLTLNAQYTGPSDNFVGFTGADIIEGIGGPNTAGTPYNDYSAAVEPAATPEPSGMILLGAGLLGLVGLSLRRKVLA